MGSWGIGIEDDDLVADVLGVFDERLKSGDSVSLATENVLSQFSESLEDTDEKAIVWLAIAKAQWSYGELAPLVLERVRAIVTEGKGLDRWKEAGDSELQKRKSKLNSFLQKIEKQNPKPKRRPKLIIRKPIFEPGICLVIKHPNNEYGAAIVLKADHSRPEYGMNLIATLNYLAPEPPSLSFFEKREWLRLTHHKWDGSYDINWYHTLGFRKVRSRILVVGKIPLRLMDPRQAKTYSGWQNLGEQMILQREWDLKSK
jgi:hypothetical protein